LIINVIISNIMKFTPPSDLTEFIVSTRYCNASDEAVVSRAEELTRDADNTTEAALNIHTWVRDHFLFGFTPVTEKASETLKAKYGWCVTKTNLQIALLRAIGIPARFHQVSVTKKALKGLASGSMYLTIKEPIWFHPWCECYLEGKWITCDLWIDRFTHKAALKAGVLAPGDMTTVVWNGKDDLNLVEPWFLEDRGIRASYDQVVDEVAATFKSIPTGIINWLMNGSNRYTARLRKQHGQPV
jgi:transglutaminase-like putative cysteine protease